MKKIYYNSIFGILSALIFGISCNDKDTQFYNVQYVAANGLVNIETKNSYALNDIFYVNAHVSRFLPEANQPNLLDIYKTTNATKLNFSYTFEKKLDATTWAEINISNNLLNIDKGTAISGYYIYGSCVYNSSTQIYEYRVGIPLLATGDYRLRFNYNSSASNVELRSESTDNNLFLNINSSSTQLDGTGYYNFTVN